MLIDSSIRRSASLQRLPLLFNFLWRWIEGAIHKPCNAYAPDNTAKCDNCIPYGLTVFVPNVVVEELLWVVQLYTLKAHGGET